MKTVTIREFLHHAGELTEQLGLDEKVWISKHGKVFGFFQRTALPDLSKRRLDWKAHSQRVKKLFPQRQRGNAVLALRAEDDKA